MQSNAHTTELLLSSPRASLGVSLSIDSISRVTISLSLQIYKSFTIDMFRLFSCSVPMFESRALQVHRELTVEGEVMSFE